MKSENEIRAELFNLLILFGELKIPICKMVVRTRIDQLKWVLGFEFVEMPKSYNYED
jgi:hypothetical protein